MATWLRRGARRILEWTSRPKRPQASTVVLLRASGDQYHAYCRFQAGGWDTLYEGVLASTAHRSPIAALDELDLAARRLRIRWIRGARPRPERRVPGPDLWVPDVPTEIHAQIHRHATRHLGWGPVTIHSDPSLADTVAADRLPAPPPVRPLTEEQRLSPRVRELAAELGVDLAAVIGTGGRGRVRRQDVLDAAQFRSDSDQPPTGSQP